MKYDNASGKMTLFACVFSPVVNFSCIFLFFCRYIYVLAFKSDPTLNTRILRHKNFPVFLAKELLNVLHLKPQQSLLSRLVRAVFDDKPRDFCAHIARKNHSHRRGWAKSALPLKSAVGLSISDVQFVGSHARVDSG